MAVAALKGPGWDTEALASPTPFLAGFWADWCLPSHLLAGAIETALEAHPGRLRAGLVDTDSEPALAERCRIQGLPTLILFRGGREVLRRVGLLTRGELLKLVDLHQ